MSKSINALKEERGKVLDQMTELARSESFDPAKHAEMKAAAEKLNAQIRALEESEDLQRSLAQPSGANRGTGNSADAAAGPFESLGDQLRAVAQDAINVRNGTGRSDPRLGMLRAPTGSGATDSDGSSFLVQTDFVPRILQRTFETGKIIAACDKLTCSSNANAMTIPYVAETSQADGYQFGGVVGYWGSEADTFIASKPKFGQLEFRLTNKVFALWRVTDEMLQDAGILQSVAMAAFPKVLNFKVEAAIFRGTGVGTPLGILNSPCKVTVPIEKGQATKTILAENIHKMWSRMDAEYWENATWYVNQDTMPQLNTLSQVVGTGGVPIYLPPGGLSQKPYGTLYGRPVVPVKYCSTLGTEGDIVLGDFSQYVLCDKGGVQAQSSLHVYFLTDEMAFRFVYRVDGKTWQPTPLTPYQGTNTVSPFVTLASR
ncbi:MAG: phage major capsid protein [Clostridiaceae bacterium]|nr:phage major capsid protein [Clostridiaceae bacterium]